MEDMGVVQIDVVPAVADFYDLRNGSSVRFLDWLLFLIGLLYAYLAIAEIFNEGIQKSLVVVGMYAGVSMAAFLGILFVRRIWAHLMFRRGPTLRQHRTYLFSANDVQVRSEAMTCSFSWQAFSRIVETRQSFLFFLSPIFGMVVPKRCVSSPVDITRVRDLVRNQFKGKLKLSS